MKVLLTGAFGTVGFSTLKHLVGKKHEIRAFDLKTPRNEKLAKRLKNVEIIWGDIRNPKDVHKSVEGVDVVLHTAAIIPPLADERPDLAREVNVGGTGNIVNAMKYLGVSKIVFTSSIAVYGDRRKNPLIRVDDPLNPNPDDEYAKQKVECEEILKSSGLKWSIFRLTYIVSVENLKFHPIMFRMPLDTRIEICHADDAGLALANAVESEEIWGKILNIAGGENCRTTYRDYIHEMMYIFGLGRDFPPDSAFSTEDYHCGYMDTEESERILNYQRHTLGDFYREVRKRYRFKRLVISTLRPLIRRKILSMSSYYGGETP